MKMIRSSVHPVSTPFECRIRMRRQYMLFVAHSSHARLASVEDGRTASQLKTAWFAEEKKKKR